MRRLLATIVAAAAASLLLPAVPSATAGSAVAATVAAEPASAENIRHLANLDYERRHGQSLPFGTDVELAVIESRSVAWVPPGLRKRTLPFGASWLAPPFQVETTSTDVAFAGTYRNGLQIIDVTDPASPELLSVYDCGMAQGDVQVFERDGRTYVGYAADDISSETVPTSGCYQDVGLDERAYGTFIVDVTDPRQPTTVSFVPFERGSHNQTVHPSGRYLYNSNSDLVLQAAPSIEVVDISDLRNPVEVTELPLVSGLDSHDITFNEDGTRAYSAALTHTLVIDTTDPADPAIIGRILDPTINIHHQSDPVTIDDPVLGERTFLVITDELAGAAGNLVCPGGGLHVYDITGELERAPVKVGYFHIPEVSVTTGTSIRCTSHVLRMHPDEGIMTIAWYARGARVIDISGLAGVSVGAPGPGMVEVGHIWFDDSDTWAAKALRIEPDGSFDLFANDIERGFDVFRYEPAPGGPEAAATGASEWLTPDQAEGLLADGLNDALGTGPAASLATGLGPVGSRTTAADGIVLSCLLG